MRNAAKITYDLFVQFDFEVVLLKSLDAFSSCGSFLHGRYMDPKESHDLLGFKTECHADDVYEHGGSGHVAGKELGIQIPEDLSLIDQVGSIDQCLAFAHLSLQHHDHTKKTSS